MTNVLASRLTAMLVLLGACAAPSADETSRVLLAEGKALVSAGDRVAGTERLRAALASAPDGATALRAEIHAWLGHALQLDRELDEALEHHGRACERDGAEADRTRLAELYDF